MTETQLLLALAAILAVSAGVLANNEPSAPDKGGSIGGVWFHGAVTWPILAKIPVIPIIFRSTGIDFRLFLLAAYLPGILLGLFWFVQRLRFQRARLFGPGCALFAAISLLSVSGSSSTALVALIGGAQLIPFLIYARAAADPMRWVRWSRQALSLVAVSLGIAGLFFPAVVIGECPTNKCSVTGELLVSSVTGNANFLGLAIAFVAPIALWNSRLRPGILALLSSVLLVELSGSRSAFAGLLVGVLAALAFHPNLGRRIGAVFGGLVFPTLLIVSAAVAIVPFGPDAFTSRGVLWARARDLIEQRPVFGWGVGYWGGQPREGSFYANYSPHNMWLEWVVAVGIVGTMLLVIVMVTSYRLTPVSSRRVFLIALFTLLALGVLESPLQPYKVGLMPFSHLLLLAIASQESNDGRDGGRPDYGPGGGRIITPGGEKGLT